MVSNKYLYFGSYRISDLEIMKMIMKFEIKTLDCRFEVIVFELCLQYYTYFLTNTLGKCIKPFIPRVMGKILSLLFFDKDGFGIK